MMIMIISIGLFVLLKNRAMEMIRKKGYAGTIEKYKGYKLEEKEQEFFGYKALDKMMTNSSSFISVVTFAFTIGINILNIEGAGSSFIANNLNQITWSLIFILAFVVYTNFRLGRISFKMSILEKLIQEEKAIKSSELLARNNVVK